MPTFQDVILAIPGLTHYYPLNENANDIVGDAHGTVHGPVEFDGTHAVFSGDDTEIELPDRDEFSAAGNSSKALTILVYQTIDDWTKKSSNNEYVHWLGKGKSGGHEFTFRYYIDGGGGEAPERKRRTSYYNFNPDGGLGTGSYFQDEEDGNGTERVITGMIWGDAGNGGKTQMWKNGELRDTDNLSDYDVYPQNTGTPVFLGSRGDGTGNLVGRLRRVAFFDRKLTEAEIKSLYDARNYEEGSGSAGGGGGGGGTPPPATQTAEVLINGATFPLSGLNTDRGSGTLVAYTKAYGSVTDTNEWGAEIKVKGGFVTEILDQQDPAAEDKNLALDARGYVLSGHGAARTFLLDNATVGARAGFTDLVIPPPPDGGGGGGEVDLTAVKAAYEAAEVALTALNGKMDALGTAIDEAAG